MYSDLLANPFNLSRRRTLQHWLLSAFGLALPTLAAAHRPALMLAKVYRPSSLTAEDLTVYWVSEKYDGVRGFWDGTQLWTRGGQPIAAPVWFTAQWPSTALDGELWAGRGAFVQAVSTVRQQTPSDVAWKNMRFMVFDLPTQPGNFDQRKPEVERLLAALNQPWVVLVPQSRINNEAELQTLLHHTVQGGGEGLMLHRGDSLYRGQRSDDLLKLKPQNDAEARVIAHLPGHGKYQGLLGALVVETTEGLRFKLGTGFSEAERRDPPAIGTWVTYRYRDTHPSGLPRFASFLRVQQDLDSH